MKLFYKIVSAVFQPFLMPTFGVLLLLNMDVFSVLDIRWQVVAVAGTFFFTALFPFVPIWFLIKRGIVKNVFMSNRRERTIPYLFSFLAYLFWAYFLLRTLHLPVFIAAVGFGSALSILLITIINIRWKISAHLSAMGGITAAIFAISFRFSINPLGVLIAALALSALVALSRIELKEHTPLQTMAGFFLGFCCVFAACLVM